MNCNLSRNLEEAVVMYFKVGNPLEGLSGLFGFETREITIIYNMRRSRDSSVV
jgi:hypothetical protein